MEQLEILAVVYRQGSIKIGLWGEIWKR